MDKITYNISDQEMMSNELPIHHHAARVTEEKGVRMGEAADIFGDLETAEDYGYVSRGCVLHEISTVQKEASAKSRTVSNPDISSS